MYPFCIIIFHHFLLFFIIFDSWRDILELDPNPIGAGCVAQVFKGILTDNNHKIPVAIKIIHPNVEDIVHIDMNILSYVAKYLDTFKSLEMLNLGETLTEFGQMMKNQLDLRIEAFNLITFNKKFINDNWAIFPKPINNYIHKNVIIETLMEGKSIMHYMNQITSDEKQLSLMRQLSDLGCRLILKMIFFDNFIHGDLHPGKQRQTGYLDFYS